jgi:Na+-translocating ferredoxin:NAD+ oxidoreductase RnfG subunit
MKCLLPFALGTAVLCFGLNTTASAADLMPGQVDFGAFSPPKEGGQYVEVKLPSNLISLAARFVEKEEPEVAELLKGLKLVRVNVVGIDKDNGAEIQKRMKSIRKDLDGKAWERIVTAQEKDQEVAIYVKMSAKDGIEGFVALVNEDNRQAVFVNIVGEIKPEQVAMLGEKLHLDPLKKIGQAAEKSADKKPEAEAEKSDE